ncbi:ATP-grasp domain-containing protein [Micromonospora wenchangensis]|uniref:ATP-grasp domain-containing protein n=1 Tax=Micromonospora wenchangensis TaxID=1185415 RepID=UPI003D75150C
MTTKGTPMGHLVFVETSGSGVNAMSYAKRSGHRVSYLYSDRYDFTATPGQRSHARRLADDAIEIDPDADAGELLVALRAAGVRTEGVDAVLTTLAFCVSPAAVLAELIGSRGTSAAAVETARDKARFRQALREAGVPSLRFAVVRNEAEALTAAASIGYPVIVKPVLGVAKAATVVARTGDDVRGHFGALAGQLDALPVGLSTQFDGRFIVEQLAVGELYSVEVATDGRVWTPLTTTRQKTGAEDPVLELGCTTPCGLDARLEQEMGAYAVQVCRAVGLDLGIFHCEMIRTAEGFRATEVNPRIAGGALPETINAVADADMFGILVDLHLGRPAPARPLRLTGAASHSVLGARSGGTVRPDLPPDWFKTHLDGLHSGWAQAAPGRALPVMRGNFDRFGIIRVVADDPATARDRCAAVKADIERELGVPLAAAGDES